MLEHCMTKHARFVREGYEQKYTIEKFRSINIAKDFPHIIQAHGNLFLLWLRKYPSGMMTLRAYCLESCESYLKCKIFIEFQDKVEVKLDCYPLHYYLHPFRCGDDHKFRINGEQYLGDAENLSYKIIIEVEDTSLHNLLQYSHLMWIDNDEIVLEQ